MGEGEIRRTLERLQVKIYRRPRSRAKNPRFLGAGVGEIFSPVTAGAGVVIFTTSRSTGAGGATTPTSAFGSSAFFGAGFTAAGFFFAASFFGAVFLAGAFLAGAFFAGALAGVFFFLSGIGGEFLSVTCPWRRSLLHSFRACRSG